MSTEKVFLDKYKAYKLDVKKLRKLKEELQVVEFEVIKKNKIVNSLQGIVLKSSVINEDKWRGFNKITFKTLVPPMEYSFSPEEGEYAREIRLRRKNEDDVDEGFEVYVVGSQKYDKKEAKNSPLTGKEFK
jgi:hypothetical protein